MRYAPSQPANFLSLNGKFSIELRVNSYCIPVLRCSRHCHFDPADPFQFLYHPLPGRPFQNRTR